MLKGRFRKLTVILISTTIGLPNFALAAEQDGNQSGRKWVFPDQPIPNDAVYVPLKVGYTSGSEVQVGQRDWFLLKDANLGLGNPVSGKNLDFTGPVLDSLNTQIYFRLVTGMILKESMIQLGMNASQARRIMEKAAAQGKDFDKVPLSELTPLPTHLAELYDNWNRPLARMNVFPYLSLPLTIAYNQSQYQHFMRGNIADPNSQVSCSTIATAAPLAQVQTRIKEKQKALDDLNGELKTTKARLQQSVIQQAYLSSQVKDYSNQLDDGMKCFGAIKDRVARGAAMPDAACLALAKNVMVEVKLTAEWDKFTGKNLKNDSGDYTVKSELEKELTALEAKLRESQGQVRALQGDKDGSSQDIETAQDNLQKLKAELASQKASQSALDSELVFVESEIRKIHDLNHKLVTNTLSKEMSQQEVQAAIDGTVDRSKRLDQLNARLDQIRAKQAGYQANQLPLMTQIDHVSRSIDAMKIQLQSIDTKLADKSNGPGAKADEIQTRINVMNEKFRGASDEAIFSEYIISVLTRRLSSVQQFRDAIYSTLKKEEETAEGYKAQIAAAEKANDTTIAPLVKEIATLQGYIGSYINDKQMGWFLETDCESREKFASQGPGIYLSRTRVGGDSPSAVRKESQASQASWFGGGGGGRGNNSGWGGGGWGGNNNGWGGYNQQPRPRRLKPKPQEPPQTPGLTKQNKEREKEKDGTLGPVDGGRWGLFNLDYDHFKAPIQGGALLNVTGYIQLAVHQIFENYDYAVNQYLDSTQKCVQLGSSGGNAAIVSQMRTAYLIWNEGGDNVAKSRVCNDSTKQTQEGSTSDRGFMAALSEVISFKGSLLDTALPQFGQARPDDLIERKAIIAIGREIGILNGTVKVNEVGTEENNQRRDDSIKALIRVLAYDYEAAAKRDNDIRNGKGNVQYVMASVAPGKVPNGAHKMKVGSTLTIRTVSGVKLYTAPIAKPNYESRIEISLNDQVKIVSMEDSKDLIRAGWVKVQTAKGGANEYWMPAWPVLSSVLLGKDGEEIDGMTMPQNCPNPRLVKTLTNFRNGSTRVARFSTNLKTSVAVKKNNIWQIDPDTTESVSPAWTNKTYMACENFSVSGQPASAGNSYRNLGGVDYTKTLGIRIIEVRAKPAANGLVAYVPVESVGGYVQTWLPNHRNDQPRIVLGEELEPGTWVKAK